MDIDNEKKRKREDSIKSNKVVEVNSPLKENVNDPNLRDLPKSVKDLVCEGVKNIVLKETALASYEPLRLTFMGMRIKEYNLPET